MNTKNTPANKMTGVRMTGGIDIDEEEMKKLPDAQYWRMGAQWVLQELNKITTEEDVESCDKRDKILGNFWHQDNTWMFICIKAERMLDLYKALVKDGKGEIR